MLDPRIPFKNRWLAAVLAFLVPGAGHLYQGRRFKGVVCGLCVLSTFFYGMALGDWSVVYWKRDPTNFLNPYYAQVFVGLPALPSLVQARRYQSPDNTKKLGIDGPLRLPFAGSLRTHESASEVPDGTVDGQISMQPDDRLGEGRAVRGEFQGELTSAGGAKENKTLAIGGVPHLGKPVSADPDRDLDIDVVGPPADGARPIGKLRGSIPRSFWDRFEAPPDDDYFLEVNRKLGKFHELAMTFTMIAGLLNILVILDAFEGPAYGYGDEPKVATEEPKRQKDVPSPPPSDKPSTPVAVKPPEPTLKR